jgi:hypothetical protein
MEDMKNLQKQFAPNSNFLKVTDEFPPYLNFQGQLVYHIEDDDWSIGIFGGFSSTGGSKGASDFSGEMYFRQYLKSYQIGILIESKVYSFSFINIYAGSQISGHKTLYKYKFEDSVGNQFWATLNNEEADFYSFDWSVEPYLAFGWNLTHLDLRLETGYHKYFSNELKLEEYDEISTDYKTDWSGVRISFLIGYRF